MSKRHMGVESEKQEEVKYFSATWETAETPDFQCLVDVLEMAADELDVEFAPVGFAEHEGGTRIRVDGQFSRAADPEEFAEFAKGLGKAVAAEVSARSVLPDMAHPDDVAAAKRIRTLSREDELSAEDFARLEDIDKPVEVAGKGKPSRREKRRSRGPRFFAGAVSFPRDTDWDAFGCSVSFLDDDYDIDVSLGSIEVKKDRIEAYLAAKVSSYDNEGADADYVQSVIAEYLGCEVELEELGHTMEDAGDMALLKRAGLDPSRGIRYSFPDTEDLLETVKRAVEGGRSTEDGPAEERLSRIVGLESVKRQLREAVGFAATRMKAGLKRPTLHMCFRGNPGTGKTTMARALATMLAEAGVTKKDKFVEADRGTLIGEYVGQTAARTKETIERAKGGVLFIDEAYALGPAGGHDEAGYDYGPEAIATLVKAMEDLRDDLVVVLAGYTEPMDSMISVNPGLRDRIAFYIDFPDYSAPELRQIADGFIERDGYAIDADASAYLSDALEDVVAAKDADFANARVARKVIERAEMRQSTLHGDDLRLHRDALESVFSDPDIARLVETRVAPIGF